MGEAAKPRCAHVAVSMAEAVKPISSRVSACPLASPCLWGKLQNLVRFAALTSQSRLEFLLVLVAVSMGEAAKPRSFCYSHVAVSMEEAAKPILSRVSACPLASSRLSGKLQSIACFAALTSPCL